MIGLLVSDIAAPRVPACCGDSEEDRAIAQLEKWGGKVERDESDPRRPVVSISIASQAQESIQYVKAFPELRVLVARFDSLSDDDLKPLEGLASLETLNLHANRITDSGLVHLQGLSNLHSLDIGDNAITDAGLAHLRPLETRIAQAG